MRPLVSCGVRAKTNIPRTPHPPHRQIAAAREAIGDHDFFLVARTDARGTSAKYGLEEAVKRANLYADAGADATFVEAPRSTEELAVIGRETKVGRGGEGERGRGREREEERGKGRGG